MDKYFGYIFASYTVAFIAIAILVVAIVFKYRSANKTLERLKASGVRRRSETSNKIS